MWNAAEFRDPWGGRRGELHEFVIGRNRVCFFSLQLVMAAKAIRNHLDSVQLGATRLGTGCARRASMDANLYVEL